MHQTGVVESDAHLGTAVEQGSLLVCEHGGRRCSILHREGPTEAAAFFRPFELDELETTDVLEEPKWSVADAEHAQRVTCGMKSNAMREIGTYVDNT
jgi:hypothetical protein